jgi:hypothetical protein
MEQIHIKTIGVFMKVHKELLLVMFIMTTVVWQDTFSNSALIFVPATQSQINLVNTTGGLTAQQQWEN